MPNVINPPERPKLTRFVTTLGVDGVAIEQRFYIAIAETPFYYFVIDENVNQNVLAADLKAVADGLPMPKSIFGYRVRKVAKRAQRSFCFEDAVVAWHSFQARQEMRAFKLRLQLAQAEKALEYMKENPHNPPSQRMLGHTDLTQGLNWNEY